jgi:hypothetical protein
VLAVHGRRRLDEVTHMRLLFARHVSERRQGTLKGVPINTIWMEAERLGLASR